MTADELAKFVADVRAECDERLAMLHAVDPATLPAELRDEYDEALADWTKLRRLTDDDVHALHTAAVEHAGRELTMAELWALVRRQ